jgi:hypothetical protein
MIALSESNSGIHIRHITSRFQAPKPLICSVHTSFLDFCFPKRDLGRMFTTFRLCPSAPLLAAGEALAYYYVYGIARAGPE